MDRARSQRSLSSCCRRALSASAVWLRAGAGSASSTQNVARWLCNGGRLRLEIWRCAAPETSQRKCGAGASSRAGRTKTRWASSAASRRSLSSRRRARWSYWAIGSQTRRQLERKLKQAHEHWTDSCSDDHSNFFATESAYRDTRVSRTQARYAEKNSERPRKLVNVHTTMWRAPRARRERLRLV